MNIAITGSTGQLGRLVISELKKRLGANSIIALARSPEKGNDLGVEVRQADYEKPSTLKQALSGVEQLLLISGSEIGRRVLQHRNVIDAALENGIKHLVYTSILHADTSIINLAEEHRATEEALRESGLNVTLLRNGWYTENYMGAVRPALSIGKILGSAGDGRISAAARQDFAAAAAVVLSTSEHQGGVFELAGDNFFTLGDLAQEVSAQSGKSIIYQNLSEEDYTQALIGLGFPEFLAQGFASWDICASKGALFDDSRQLSKLIGRATTPLSEVVKRVLDG